MNVAVKIRMQVCSWIAYGGAIIHIYICICAYISVNGISICADIIQIFDMINFPLISIKNWSHIPYIPADVIVILNCYRKMLVFNFINSLCPMYPIIYRFTYFGLTYIIYIRIILIFWVSCIGRIGNFMSFCCNI